MAGFGVIASRLYGLVTQNPSTARVVVDHVGPVPDDRVLEVGCGAGGALHLLAQRIGVERVAAVDPSPTFVAMVRRRLPGADVRVAGAEEVPFADGSFSLVLSIASFHHWDDQERGLTTLVGMLRPGGRFVVAERTLRRPGHGITARQAERLQATLVGLGQTDVGSVQRRAGWRWLTIVSARRPG